MVYLFPSARRGARTNPMNRPDPIGEFLSELRIKLHLEPGQSDRVIAETENHLLEAADRLYAGGLSSEEAAREAIARFGSAEEVAKCFSTELEKEGAMQSMITNRPAVLVLLGAMAIVLTVVGTALFFFLQHHDSESVSTETANAEFLQLRARFSDQQPLLDMRGRQPFADVRVSRAVAPLHSFHTVVFDTRRGQRIVRITVPYRFGRLFARHSGGFRWLGELTFLDDTEFDPEPIRLSLDQVDQHGPGLIVDYRHASGGQFIAWVE
jgi:hypothetical protein